MKKFIKIAFRLIPKLMLALGVVYGIVLLTQTISSANPEVSAAIVGGMATVLVGISVVLLSQAHERKRASIEAHRLKKVAIYQKFIDMISKMIGANNPNLSIKAPTEKELTQYLFNFKSEILLWGSPNVVQAQINFEKISEGVADNKKLFLAVNNLYLAIREDIGLSNSGLNNLELVKLHLNDQARKDLD